MGSPTTAIMKMLDPYMIIRSPGPRTPALTASAGASGAPAMTGVPAARPLARAAAAETRPTTSVGQTRRGKRTGSTVPATHSSIQALERMS